MFINEQTICTRMLELVLQNKNVKQTEVSTTTFSVMDSIDLGLLATQTAASILAALKDMPLDGFPEHGVGGIIQKYDVNFAKHGYINALQSQVEILYNIVKASTDKVSPKYNPILVDVNQKKLIAAALSSYQDWKTAHINELTKKYGRDFGKNTGFNKSDWSEYNQLFLEDKKRTD